MRSSSCAHVVRAYARSRPMDANLTERIQLARIEARRRGHAEVLPEHLLAVIIDAADAVRALRARGIDPTELRERLEARLSGLPAPGGYRDRVDASLTPLAPAIDRVVRRLTTRRWLSLSARVTCADA